jgi:hypothetical protein
MYQNQKRSSHSLFRNHVHVRTNSPPFSPLAQRHGWSSPGTNYEGWIHHICIIKAYNNYPCFKKMISQWNSKEQGTGCALLYYIYRCTKYLIQVQLGRYFTFWQRVLSHTNLFLRCPKICESMCSREEKNCSRTMCTKKC